MKLIPNQPVIFDEVIDDCHLNYTRYKQKVELGDVTNFQIQIGDCPLPENKIINGGFATDLSGWTQPAGFSWQAINGEMCNTNPANQNIEQLSLIPGLFYRVEITVTELASTDTTDVNSGKIDVRLGFNNVGVISSPGTYVFYGVCLVLGHFQILKRTNTTVCVDDVVVLEVNIDQIITVFDENDTFIVALKVSDFITAFTQITDEFTLFQNFLTTFIDWTALAIPAGCYKICLLDPCVNTNFQNYLPNGEFTIDDLSPFVEWVFGGPGLFDIDGQHHLLFFGNALDTGNAFQTGVKNGGTYTVELNIVQIADCEVWIKMGSNITTKFTTTGIKSEVLVSNGTGISIVFEGTSGVNPPLCELEYVRIPIDSSDYVVDHCSPVFDVRASHDCTLRINACDDPRVQDDMGFLFKQTGFNPTIRVHSKLVNSQYDFPERDVRTNSFGKRQVVFFRRTKLKTIKISRQPEYVHDFLSLLFGFDHISIENIEYNVESEEYPLIYDKEDDFARAAIDVTLKEELIRNSLCLNEGDTGPCQIDDNLLIDVGGGGPILEPDTGVEIEIPG